MILGRVMSVAEDTPVTDLGADASAGATTITVIDPSVLNEDGGTLIIRDDVNSETKTYTAVNMDTGVVTGVAALTNAYVAGTGVVQSSTYVKERYAEVWVDSSEDELDSTSVVALVPNVYFDRLPLGIRDVNTGERILMDFNGSTLVVRDFPGEPPTVDGSYITPSTLPPVSATDGLPPGTSPTPTVRPGIEFLGIEWDPVSNADFVTYEVHISTVGASFSPGPTTLYGEIGGTIMFIQKMPDGSALVVGTTYYVRLIAKDKDGAAAPGTAGSGSVIKLPSSSAGTDGAAPSSSPTPTVTNGVGILSVKWTPITNNDPVTYDVHLSTTTGFTPSGTSPGTGTCVGSTAAGSFVINSVVAGTPLVFGTTYYVKLVAKDADGSAAASAQASGTLVALPSSQGTTDGAAPASSPTPTVVGGPGYLNATWTPVANNDAVRYEVHLSTTTGFTPSGTTPGTGTCYAITPGSGIVINSLVGGGALVFGTTYYVKLIARDNDGAAAAGTQGSGTITRVTTGSLGTDGVAPSSSPTPVVKGGPTFVSAEWAPSANADPVQYEVHLSTTTGFTPSGTSAGTGTCYAVTDGSSIVIKTTVAGAALAYATTYYVKIVAKDADGSAAASAQGSAQLVQILTGDVGTDTITAANIAANAITSSELAANAVTAGKIAAGTIVAADISAGSITGDRLVAGTITATQIASGTITATQIATDTITATQIAANAITTSELNAGAVTAAKIATDTITSNEIAANAITTSELNAGAVTAAKIAANTITAAQIAAGTITATEIAGDTITAANIAANAITASELAANSVVAGDITANAVQAGNIAANAVTAGTILAGAVTAAKLESTLVLGTTIATAATGQRVVLDGSGAYGSVGFYLLRTNAEGFDETLASITTQDGAAFGVLSVGTLISDDVVTFQNRIGQQIYIDSLLGDDLLNDGTYPKTLLADNFNRTSASGWGTASDGRHNWFLSDGTGATNFTVAPGTPGLAKISMAASTARSIFADSGSLFEEVRFSVQTDKVPTAAQWMAGIQFRGYSRISGGIFQVGTSIRVELQVPGGGATVPVIRIGTNLEGSPTFPSTPAVTDGQVWAANAKWYVRAQCYTLPNGQTRVRAYAWKTGSAEPTTWTATADIGDVGLDMMSGAIGFHNNAGAIGNAPVVVTFSDFYYSLLDPEILWADDTDTTGTLASPTGPYTYAPAGGGPFATLEAAIETIDRYNQGQVFIIYEYGSDTPYWPHTLIDGFVGGGKLVITAGAMSAATTAGIGLITGTLSFQGNNHFIRVGRCIITDDNSSADDQYNCTIVANVTRHLEVASCQIQGNGNPTWMVAFIQGSEGNVTQNQMAGLASGGNYVKATEASFVKADNNRGPAPPGGGSAYHAASSIIFKTGTWPNGGGGSGGAGVIATGGGVGSLIDTTASPAGDGSGNTPPTSTKKTKTWAAAGGSTYGMGFGTWSPGDVTQGQYGGSQNHKGVWKLPGGVQSTLSGKTIDGAWVTVTRASYGGASGGTSVFMCTVSPNSLSGSPSAPVSGPTNIGSLAWGQTKTFKIPNGFASDLAGNRTLAIFNSGGSPYIILKNNLKLKVTYH